jgi:hypothetical protein
MYTVPNSFSVLANCSVSPKTFSSSLAISSSSVTAYLYLSFLSNAVAIFLLAFITLLSSGLYSYSYKVFTFWMQVRELSELPIF